MYTLVAFSQIWVLIIEDGWTPFPDPRCTWFISHLYPESLCEERQMPPAQAPLNIMTDK